MWFIKLIVSVTSIIPSFPIFKTVSLVNFDISLFNSSIILISRELNKPAVVGVKNITRILKTGDIVELDATNGKITKIK